MQISVVLVEDANKSIVSKKYGPSTVTNVRFTIGDGKAWVKAAFYGPDGAWAATNLKAGSKADVQVSGAYSQVWVGSALPRRIEAAAASAALVKASGMFGQVIRNITARNTENVVADIGDIVKVLAPLFVHHEMHMSFSKVTTSDGVIYDMGSSPVVSDDTFAGMADAFGGQPVLVDVGAPVVAVSSL
jgi:hypothetical protein